VILDFSISGTRNEEDDEEAETTTKTHGKRKPRGSGSSAGQE